MISQHERQQGIVLISVVVFLILILLLLKISLQSSRMDAFKTSIHYETSNALEAAEFAQMSARKYIMAGGYKSKSDANLAFPCDKKTTDSSCINDFNKLVFDYWSDISELPVGAYLASASKCNKGNSEFWKCVNWNRGISGVELPFNTDKLKSTEYNPYVLSADSGSFPGATPRFIVQIVSRDDTAIVFRVYAVGFGRNTDNANPTVKMLESQYILPKEGG